MGVILFLFLGSLPGSDSFALREELVLGADEDQDLFFTSHTRVAAYTDGRLFVLEPSQHQILVFDAKGALVDRFGRRGTGPGEFSEPVSLALDRQGRPHVFDAGFHKMVVFDAAGNLIREKRFAQGIHGIYHPVILDDGTIAFTAYELDDTFQVTYDLSLYNKDLEPIHQIYSVALPKTDWRQPRDNAFWVAFLVAQLDTIPDLPLHAGVGNSLVTGVGKDDEGALVDSAGKAVGTFHRDVKAHILTDEAREALCEPVWQDLAANTSYSALTDKPWREQRIWSASHRCK